VVELNIKVVGEEKVIKEVVAVSEVDVDEKEVVETEFSAVVIKTDGVAGSAESVISWVVVSTDNSVAALSLANKIICSQLMQ